MEDYENLLRACESLADHPETPETNAAIEEVKQEIRDRVIQRRLTGDLAMKLFDALKRKKKVITPRYPQ